jgi:hypothetical protein
MNRIVQSLSLLLGSGGALFVAVVGAWRDLPPLALLVRAALAGGVVYAFVRVAGDLGGRAVLRQVAERELARKASSRVPGSTAGEGPDVRKAA